MNEKYYLRGHEIEEIEGRWYFCDNGEPSTTYESRPCGKCNEYQTSEGHDPCLGTLVGTMNACCGHGDSRQAYIQLLDGTSICGDDGISIMNILKKHSK